MTLTFRRPFASGFRAPGCPAFGATLDRADFLAVVAYVDSLNGVTPPVNPFAARQETRRLPPEAQRGRQLFADQVRGVRTLLGVPSGGRDRDAGRAAVYLGSGKRGGACVRSPRRRSRRRPPRAIRFPRWSLNKRRRADQTVRSEIAAAGVADFSEGRGDVSRMAAPGGMNRCSRPTTIRSSKPSWRS